MATNVRSLGTGSLVIVLAVAGALRASDAWAQGATPASLAQATVPAEAAKQTLMKVQISSDVARAIVGACVEFSKNSTPRQATSIFLLGPTGDIVEAHIMDGVLPIAIEAAELKAKTALYARTSSAAVGQRFSTVDARVIRMNFGRDQGLAYYFASGGLPIVVEGQIIGAIGVGGGVGAGFDERCAHQALEKVLGPQPPLTQAAPTGVAPAGAGGGSGQGAGQ